eukprot:TRINITY_DN2663_c0_g1_i1.p1 TRINITY_DN2663_c0_g1~~TRINITY_DN2663_c0_g1_i1.p1  ORF type:complete len:1041 (+),score=147.74 TRINITY_DN2663_c0_g1_i1:324-3446(+)
MPTNSSPSLPTSPSPTRKTFSSQHNVWNKLLFRAERRLPQPESHLYLPHDPGDDHLRASLENYLINHQLQIDSVFRIPVREPSRPKRKATKRCRPRQSNPRAQQSHEHYVVRGIVAHDEEPDVIVNPEVPDITTSAANPNEKHIMRRKKPGNPNGSQGGIPLSQRLLNDRDLFTEINPKPPSLLVPPQQHAPERSRRRVSKSTPLSTMHSTLSSLEPSEDSPTLYSCDSRAVASRIESTADAMVDDSSLEIVPVDCSEEFSEKSIRTKGDKKKSNGGSSLEIEKHGSNEDKTMQVFSISSSSDEDDIWQPEAFAESSERTRHPKQLTDHGSMKRVTRSSKPSTTSGNSYFRIASSSNSQGSQHEAAGAKSRQTRCEYEIRKDHRSPEKVKDRSKRDAKVRESVALIDASCEDEALRVDLVGARPRRAKRYPNNADVHESSERAENGSKSDISLGDSGKLLSSEDDVSGSRSAKVRSRRAKRHFNEYKRQGIDKKIEVRPEAYRHRNLISLTSSSENEESESEDLAYHRPGFAFRKSVQNLSRTKDLEDHRNDSQEGIVVLPPDSEDITPMPRQLPSVGPLDRNDYEVRNEPVSKHDGKDVISRPQSIRYPGKEMTNKRIKSRTSLSPVPMESGRTLRSMYKHGRNTDLPKLSTIDTKPPKVSSNGSVDEQRKGALGDDNRKIFSEILSKSLLPAQDKGHGVALPSEVEIEGCNGAGSSEVPTCTALSGSNGCEKDGNRNGPHSSQGLAEDCEITKDCDLHLGRKRQSSSLMTTPSSFGKKREVRIPLTIRIRQPKSTPLDQKLEKRDIRCSLRSNAKSEENVKAVHAKKCISGLIDELKSHPEGLGMLFDEVEHKSFVAERVKTNNLEEIDSGNKSKACTSSRRYSLRSSKQGREQSPDVQVTKRSTRKREDRKYYAGLDNSLLKFSSTTVECRSTSQNDDCVALSPTHASRSNDNEVIELNSSRPSEDGEVLCKDARPLLRVQSGVRKKHLSAKQSSSRRLTREVMKTRAKKRKTRGEHSSNRFGVTVRDVAFGPLQST